MEKIQHPSIIDDGMATYLKNMLSAAIPEVTSQIRRLLNTVV
jgi:hypothetical protein